MQFEGLLGEEASIGLFPELPIRRGPWGVPVSARMADEGLAREASRRVFREALRGAAEAGRELMEKKGMEPLLCAGDVARVVCAGMARAGDVVLVELPGGALALHRAVRLLPAGRLLSKGDFSGRAEELGAEAVVGRADAFRLAGGSGWAPYRQGPLFRGALCLLSRLLAAGRPAAFGPAARRLACKAIWRMGQRARRRMLDESGGAEPAAGASCSGSSLT